MSEIKNGIKKPKTLFDKVWEKHVITGEPGEAQLLYIDLHLIHEVTSPQAFSGLRLAGRKVRRPDLTFGTMDHNTPTIMSQRLDIKDKISKAQLDALAANCKEFGIELVDMFNESNGIVHIQCSIIFFNHKRTYIFLKTQIQHNQPSCSSISITKRMNSLKFYMRI